MWWETHARRPRARQNVLLSSAPHASTCRWRRQRERQHARDRAARAPQRQRPPARDPQHGVVRARVDRPVVEEERVGDRCQPRDGVLVLVRDRLVGDVPARHHQRLADVGQQQVVQRAVREHHAQLRRPRSDRGGDARARPPRREHDRPVAALQQRRLDGVELDQLARGLEVGGHQRERLLLAVLARPQLGDGVLVGRQAGEMEPADALHRDHAAGLQHRHRPRKGVRPPTSETAASAKNQHLGTGVRPP